MPARLRIGRRASSYAVGVVAREALVPNRTGAPHGFRPIVLRRGLPRFAQFAPPLQTRPSRHQRPGPSGRAPAVSSSALSRETHNHRRRHSCSPARPRCMTAEESMGAHAPLRCTLGAGSGFLLVISHKNAAPAATKSQSQCPPVPRAYNHIFQGFNLRKRTILLPLFGSLGPTEAKATKKDTSLAEVFAHTPDSWRRRRPCDLCIREHSKADALCDSVLCASARNEASR